MDAALRRRVKTIQTRGTTSRNDQLHDTTRKTGMLSCQLECNRFSMLCHTTGVLTNCDRADMEQCAGADDDANASTVSDQPDAQWCRPVMRYSMLSCQVGASAAKASWLNKRRTPRNGRRNQARRRTGRRKSSSKQHQRARKEKPGTARTKGLTAQEDTNCPTHMHDRDSTPGTRDSTDTRNVQPPVFHVIERLTRESMWGDPNLPYRLDETKWRRGLIPPPTACHERINWQPVNTAGQQAQRRALRLRGRGTPDAPDTAVADLSTTDGDHLENQAAAAREVHIELRNSTCAMHKQQALAILGAAEETQHQQGAPSAAPACTRAAAAHAPAPHAHAGQRQHLT